MYAEYKTEEFTELRGALNSKSPVLSVIASPVDTLHRASRLEYSVAPLSQAVWASAEILLICAETAKKLSLSDLKRQIGGSEDIPPVGLKWLSDENPTFLHHHLPGQQVKTARPRHVMNSTEDGNLSVSWTGQNHLFHLEVDTVSKNAYWHLYDRNQQESKDGDISLKTVQGWIQIEEKLNQIFPEQ